MAAKIKWPAAVAIAVYFLWGILLIAQKPGLQYDEALMTAGAVHLRHSAEMFRLNVTPSAWACPFGRCIPLMSLFYIGAVKNYVALPFFLVFGPRTPFARLASLLLGAVGIWGIHRLVAEQFGRVPAALVAFVIALNPAYVDQTAFDNGAVAAAMAGLGLTCAGIALYIRRRAPWAALLLGAAIGFTVWARANAIWIIIAGAIALFVVLRSRLLSIPVRHWAALIAGGMIGGAPFLAYQVLSGGATWTVQDAFRVDTPLTMLLPQRLFWLADTLLSDGEHRVMWSGPDLPAWQLWLFPAILLAASVVCLFASGKDAVQQRFGRIMALTFLATAAYMCFSRLMITEHHMILLVPIAAIVVVAACATLQARYSWARALSIAVFFVYGASAIYWQVAAIRGLKHTGGVGVWSNAELDLARYLDQNYRTRDVKLLDWGLLYNLYTLTDERVNLREIYGPQSEDRNFNGAPWIDEIREGGVFILHGPDVRQFPKPSAGFLHALAMARPQMKTWSVSQRNGSTYAEVIEITPDSVTDISGSTAPPPDSLSTGEASSGVWLSGFYPPEDGNFRWTKREFSARLGSGETGGKASHLTVEVYVPEAVVRKIGAVTLNARFEGHSLSPQTWDQAGRYTYTRDLDPSWITPGANKVDFSLDKSVPAGVIDSRELGIIVSRIGLE